MSQKERRKVKRTKTEDERKREGNGMERWKGKAKKNVPGWGKAALR